MIKDSTNSAIELNTITVFLRDSEPVIDDDCFSASVMTKLPQTHELPLWKKNTLLITATAIGSVFVAWQLPHAAIVDVLNTITTDWLTLLTLAAPLTYVTAVTAMWAASD
jgi:hypothetical protein